MRKGAWALGKVHGRIWANFRKGAKEGRMDGWMARHGTEIVTYKIAPRASTLAGAPLQSSCWKASNAGQLFGGRRVTSLYFVTRRKMGKMRFDRYRELTGVLDWLARWNLQLGKR